MKKLICSIAYVFFTIVAAKNINAQGLKFGHINSNEIMLAMPEFDSAGIKLEKFRHELEKLLETMTLELNDKYNAYIKDNKSLSDIVKKVKEQELSDMNRRIGEFQRNAQSRLQEKQAELFNPVVLKLDKAIRETGEENGFLYVFDTSQPNLLYLDKNKSTDVSSMVKMKLGIK